LKDDEKSRHENLEKEIAELKKERREFMLVCWPATTPKECA